MGGLRSRPSGVVTTGGTKAEVRSLIRNDRVPSGWIERRPITHFGTERGSRGCFGLAAMTSTPKHVRRPTLAAKLQPTAFWRGAPPIRDGWSNGIARELAPGMVVPDLMESNLRDGTAIRQAIESALGSVADTPRR